MWSYIQHTRIRKQVGEEYEKRKHNINERDVKSNAGNEQDTDQHLRTDHGREAEKKAISEEERNGQSSPTKDRNSSSKSQGDKLQDGKEESEKERVDRDSVARHDTRSSKSNGDRASSHTTEAGDNSASKNQDVEKKSTHSDEDDEDPYTVRTRGDDDPFDPKNWPLLDRCKNIAILALLIFVQAWAGAAASMANLPISIEFHVSQVAENLSTSMYLFGIGSGALFVGPLSETLGRNPVYLGGTFLYMLFVLGCALTPNYGGQIVCRFFVGLCSSATLAINGGSVRDQFRPVKRSWVFPVIAWANVAAPVIAPIAGGWIVADTDISWRWTEYITLIISLFAFTIAFLFLPETHLPTLLSWKAKHLRTVTGDSRYTTAGADETFIKKIRGTIALPVKFFAKEAVIAVFGGYLVLLYVLLFSFLSGFDYIFKKTYNLSTQFTGSCFGAIAAGSTAFTLLAPGFYAFARHKTEHVRGRSLKPEFRLWPAIVTGPLLPIALFWLGWTSYASISIWSGLCACFLFGICLTAIYVSVYEYIIDSYGDHSSIALASITTVRYFVAGGMVMAARPMYINIGVQYSMTWLGCVAAVLAPAPLLFWKFGARMRDKSPYAKGDDEV